MNYCNECGSKDMILSDYMLICTQCGTVNNMNFLVDDKPINNLTNHYIHSNSYKCTNYFKRLIRCMQDKSNTKIKDDLIELIKYENKIYNMTTFEILKKHKLFKYYIHIPQIDNLLYGIIPSKINQNDELKLYEMFYVVLVCVRKNLPNRSQCVRYKPVLKFLFQIIGRYDIASLIPDVKTKKAKSDFKKILNVIVNDETFKTLYLKEY